MRLPPTFAALRHRPFRRIWIASFGSMTGSWLQITGRAYLAYEITGSTSALGAVYFFSYIPQLVLAPHAGVLADRFDRRRMLVVVQLLLVGGALAMGVLAATETATVVNVSAVSLAIGIVQVLIGPVSQAVIPALVPTEDLSSAIALESANVSATRIVGPLLAGLLIPTVGVAWTFYGNAVASAALVVMWARTPLPAHVPVALGETALQSIRAAVRFVRRTPEVGRPMVVVAFLSAVGLVYQPLAVAFATDVLAAGDSDTGAGYYGVLQAALGVGSVVGILGFAGMGRRFPGRALVVTMAGFSVLLVAFGLTTSFAAALVAFVGVGAFHFANSTLALDLVQHGTPDGMRGRVLSLHGMAWVGLFPFTSAVGGAAADAFGLRATLVWAGVACAAFTILYGRRAHAAAELRPQPVPAPAVAA